MKFSYLIRACGFIILCFISLSGTAQAAGIGFYMQGGGGNAKWEADDLGGQFDFKSDAGHAGLGFVVNSNVSRNSLFNYRASLGYEKVIHDPDNDFGDIKLDSIVLDQDFGFGVYRSKRMRVWVGPELRISYSSGKPDDSENLEHKLWGLGAGPVAGINFHVSRVVTLGIKEVSARSVMQGRLRTIQTLSMTRTMQWDRAMHSSILRLCSGSMISMRARKPPRNEHHKQFSVHLSRFMDTRTIIYSRSVAQSQRIYTAPVPVST